MHLTKIIVFTTAITACVGRGLPQEDSNEVQRASKRKLKQPARWHNSDLKRQTHRDSREEVTEKAEKLKTPESNAKVVGPKTITVAPAAGATLDKPSKDDREDEGIRDDDGRDTIQLYGGDAEKENAVDWGAKGEHQLKVASVWESWRTDADGETTTEIPAEDI